MRTKLNCGTLFVGISRIAVMIAAIFVVGVAPALCQDNCEPTVWDLTAGQFIDVGSVTVTNDDVNIYVTYSLDFPGATFGELHLWVGNDLETLPMAGNGAPIPGQFCNVNPDLCSDATGLISYTFTIPFADLELPGLPDVCGEQLYVVPHAEVSMDSDGDGDQDDETAFGGDAPGDGPRWWFYGLFTVCCGDTPPMMDLCETAFAKGGWVWTTGRKSNPEDLPSLELTKNRWGWAVNLFSTGETNYDIWAGAGLNDTSKGTLVGELTIDWDGAVATVLYEVFEPWYSLAEVHLYAGDEPPVTIAPGQYGFLDAPDAPTYTFMVPLADTDGDGVWFVAHAVVCTQ